MKFELEEYHRNVTDNDLLTDLIRVAKTLSKKTLTTEEYSKIGNYHVSTYQRRFGGWIKALKKADLNYERKNKKVNTCEIIEDLRNVAKKINSKTLSASDYSNYGKFSISTVTFHFKTWNNALEKADLQIRKISKIAPEELFQNIEKVWILLGKQPRYTEMTKPISKYSAGAYEQHFGTWRKALEAFVNYINQEEKCLIEEEKELDSKAVTVEIENDKEFKHKTKRNINLRLRFLIMRRDNFKCRICGKSPANDPGITLHVDHIVSWRNGGETILDNLQTLCSVCNIGKSDLEMTKSE